MNYEINEGTLAIIAEGGNKSRILEDNKEYVIDNRPYEVMNYSCKYFGSSYEGRKEGTKAILNVEYKVPIIVENTNNLIFFSTTSPSADDCSWISLKDINNFYEVDNGCTEVVFNNGIKIVIPVSKRMIENQVLRASRLDLIIRNRQNIKNS